MRIKSAKIIGTILASIVLALSAFAHETDQFTLPLGRDFADLGRYLNNWVFETIDRAVIKTNQKIDRCLNDKHALAAAQSSDEIVAAVNGEFPNAYDVIEGLEHKLVTNAMRQKYPGMVVSYKEQFTNIYQHVHFPLDPRQIFRIWHASTIKVYGTYLGNDKIGHFTDMGRHYYKAYSAARRKGESEEDAIRAAVEVGTRGPMFSESGMVGYLSAGAYSNADNAANYLGFLFYRNLTDPMIIHGKLQQPMLVHDGPHWKIAPYVRRDSDFLAVFISDHLNEALNPSHFEADMRDEVRKAVKNRTERILYRYSDEHGNRRSREYFDGVLNDMRTYYGQDYGYRGPPNQLVTISNSCFESFGPSTAPTARDSTGNCPLHLAACSGDVQTVKRLIQQGADVNVAVRSKEQYSPEWGNTPMHYACRDGRAEVVQTLLDAGANVNATNDRGQTPLHRAAIHPDLVRMLIAKGANVNAADAEGRTPLHWAAMDGQNQSIEALLETRADSNVLDKSGQTPLHCAARFGQTTCASTLLRHGANVNARAGFGATPLHVAASTGAAEVVTLFLDRGADLRTGDDFGWTPLHDATSHGQLMTAGLLLGRGASINAADNSGATPLHLAVRNGQESVAQMLLDHGADSGARNRIGSTALHEAVLTQREPLVALLLSHGADGSIRNSAGLTPLDLASSRGYRQIADLLKQRRPTVSAGVR